MLKLIAVGVLILCLAPSLACAQTGPSATTTTLSVTAAGSGVSTVAPGTVIELTATVLAGSTPVTPGQVEFCDATVNYCTDIHLLGLAQLLPSGTATLKFVPGIGTHSYKAVFLGTNANATSSSSASPLTVTGTKLQWSFSTQYQYTPIPTPDYPQAVAIADFNGDGKLDLAVTSYTAGLSSSNVSVFLGNGDGTFTAAPELPAITTEAGALVVGDFNGDGKPDIAVALPDIYEVTVLLGNGDGTFTQGQILSDTDGPFSIATGDFNGDGIADLAVVNPGGKTITILLGNGDGTFTPTPTSPTFSNIPICAAVGDFTGNGKADLAVALEGTGSTDPGSVAILDSNGDGTFTQLPTTSAVAANPTSITAADFNGEGILDLAVSSSSSGLSGQMSTITVLMGNGNGTFTTANDNLTVSGFLSSTTVGDVENNGIADILAANASSNSVSGYLGAGDGTFGSGSIFWGVGPDPISVAAGDFNGDGFMDFAAVLNNTNTVEIVTSDVTGTAAAITTTTTLDPIPASLTYGQSLTLSATVQPASGATPIGTVTFYNGTTSLGSASLNGSGAALPPLTLPVGTYSITASFGGSATDAGSTSSPPTVVSVAPAATTTTLTASPNPAAFGASVTLSATVASTAGTPTGGVSFYDGPALLGTGALALGQATYSASSLSVGSHSITAQYAATTDFAQSTSAAVTVMISPADFSISAAPAARTVYTGEAASFTVIVVPGTGFNLPVDLSCSQLPANTSCKFSLSTIAGGSGSATLVVQSSAPQQAANSAPFSAGTGMTALAGLLLFFVPRRLRRLRKGWPMLLAIFALLAASAAMSGCSGRATLLGGTPVGVRTIIVTGAATNGSQTLAHSTTVTLNVQSLF